jgi:propionyl-CoA synthetase
MSGEVDDLAGDRLVAEEEHSFFFLSSLLGKPVIDHYWQTETGWPMLTAVPGVEQTPIKFGSPSFPAYGFDLKLLRESDASEAGADEKAVVAFEPPLPGVMALVQQQTAQLLLRKVFRSLRIRHGRDYTAPAQRH